MVIAAAWLHPAAAGDSIKTQKFEFVSSGNRLVGFVDVPSKGEARALIVIIPGYGATDVAGRTSYYDLRSRFTELGITTVIWDKPGCGQSEGTFDPDQPVASSAKEVLEAIQTLRQRKTPGAQEIGLWGISRAGWIAPLAIAQDPGIAFWISVSGVGGKETFPYFLESNLRIEGRTESEVQHLLGQWRRGFEITSHGGTFEDYLVATEDLRRDPFMVFLSGGGGEDKQAFLKERQRFLSGEFQTEMETGLMVYVPHFAEVLMHINIPVLAIFGENDRNVNWRDTAALYSRTIGQNPKADLTIRTFADGDHNIQQSTTGGLREILGRHEHHASDGYYEAMENWLKTAVLE